VKKICIVTTRHISYNPRVLKEADALQRAGYEVAVVAINHHAQMRRFDEELMQSRHWRLCTVNYRKEVPEEKKRWILLGIKQRLFDKLSLITPRWGFAERAKERAFDQLLTLAKRERADLYIAHHAEALGIAHAAAGTHNAFMGFDAEDFHTGMNESGTPGREEALVAYLERKYLPQCDYITAASKGIAEAYRDKYGVSQPEVVLNVFPFEKPETDRVNEPVRFYWYSQVIGPNRGLELLLQAAGQVRMPFEIHLRGSMHSDAFRAQLEEITRAAGIAGQVFFHEPILAEQIIRDGSHFDVGIALESDISVNRNICVTNKVFSYLMSGLAIIGTDTYGQKDIFTEFPGAVRICRMNNAEDLTRAMQFYISHPQELLKARAAAAALAAQKFNWEKESKVLLDRISKVF
jgi:glycosyltransferase involved in cell wall biosynthesis